jgi:LuxR family transcriptional regulator, activator of conjugal transfer of Ti plasmids
MVTEPYPSCVELHRIFQNYIDRLSESTDVTMLQESMTDATRALELSCFAYLRISERNGGAPQLISTYPSTWTAQYLKHHYERFDPVITQVLKETEPFQWGLNSTASILSRPQQELFKDAARFGIARGFTIAIHDGRGPIAAVTFAADEHRGAAFSRRIEAHGQVLQLMAMYFHAHVRRQLSPDRVIDGVSLLPREFECLDGPLKASQLGRSGVFSAFLGILPPLISITSRPSSAFVPSFRLSTTSWHPDRVINNLCA